MYKIMERHLIKKQQSNLKAAHLALSYRRIIDELRTDPFRPTHHFEILEKRKPRPSLYSKRLSRSNRIVYTVDPQTGNNHFQCLGTLCQRQPKPHSPSTMKKDKIMNQAE